MARRKTGRFAVVDRSSRRLDRFRSEKDAHRVAHAVLAARPDLAPLTVEDLPAGTGTTVEVDWCGYRRCEFAEAAETPEGCDSARSDATDATDDEAGLRSCLGLAPLR